MRPIRVQADRNAHDAPWRIAIEKGFFAQEGLNVEYVEGNTRCEDFGERTKESGLVGGELDLYPVCEWGAIKRVHDLGHSRILATDATVRRGAIMVKADSQIRDPKDLAGVPISVTLNSGTHYATVEALERYLHTDQIHVVHAEDRLTALLEGRTEAASLMEPMTSQAEACGALMVLELTWYGNIVAGERVDPETGERVVRALTRAVRWLGENEERGREEILRDVPEEQRKTALVPKPVEPAAYDAKRFRETYEWMVERGLIDAGACYEELVRG